MKRTWIVFVEEGVGHELHDTISNSSLYGPFTEPQAQSFAKKLNDIFIQSIDEEHLIATASPLDGFNQKQILKKYKDIMEQEDE